MSEKRFIMEDGVLKYGETGEPVRLYDVVDLLNGQQEQLDLYKEAILTMLGLLADKGIILSGVKDE